MRSSTMPHVDKPNYSSDCRAVRPIENGSYEPGESGWPGRRGHKKRHRVNDVDGAAEKSAEETCIASHPKARGRDACCNAARAELCGGACTGAAESR